MERPRSIGCQSLSGQGGAGCPTAPLPTVGTRRGRLAISTPCSTLARNTTDSIAPAVARATTSTARRSSPLAAWHSESSAREHRWESDLAVVVTYRTEPHIGQNRQEGFSADPHVQTRLVDWLSGGGGNSETVATGGVRPGVMLPVGTNPSREAFFTFLLPQFGQYRQR